MTDARQLTKQLWWGFTNTIAANETFDIIDGNALGSSWMWSHIAGWFGIEAAPFNSSLQPLEQQMANDAMRWQKIAAEHQLAEPAIDRLVSAWHTDSDLGRPIEVVTDMSKSRRLGFLDYQASDEAFFRVFEALRAGRLIP